MNRITTTKHIEDVLNRAEDTKNVYYESFIKANIVATGKTPVESMIRLERLMEAIAEAVKGLGDPEVFEVNYTG